MNFKKILFLISILLYVGCSHVDESSTTPQNALQRYLEIEDDTFAWELRETYQVGSTKAHSIILTSQKWQDIVWKHELIIFEPSSSINHDGALLFITGSSIKDGEPKISNPNNETSQQMAHLANENNAVVALLRQVPNQPLYGGLYEDALISYTLNEFRKDGDYTWPLLFPMVKSAIKAMDAVQEFSSEKLNNNINHFVISGASKRGWTSWLTAATNDDRVVAIAPMVIDMLNMPATLSYQKEIYGAYSKEIEDYVDLEIPQAMESSFGKSLVDMIDPYSYRSRLTMPKMIFFGTNDPYWTVDAVKHYIDEIPGNNLLHYVANAGHGLGNKRQVLTALCAFFDHVLTHKSLPVYSWSINESDSNINLNVKTTSDNLVRAILWSSHSATRDFRKALWSSENITLSKNDKSLIEVALNYPEKDFRAFYLDLIYLDDDGEEYSVSTRMFVADANQVFE